jgi:AcrR family transcriptional regulator
MAEGRGAGHASVSQIEARRRDRRTKADGGDRASAVQWEAILDAAARVFHRVGYQSANLDDIAAEVGLNRSSIYYYVGGKSELLYELGQRTISDSVPGLLAIAERDLPPADMVRALVGQHMEMLQSTYPRLFVFLNERRPHIEDDLNDLIDEAGETRVAMMAAAIEAGVAAGDFRADLVPRRTARYVIGMCAETRFWWRPDGPQTLVEIGEEIADLVLSGMVARA